jgi:hypothetical protein
VCQEQLKDWLETHQTALMEGCNGKLDRYNDRKISRKLSIDKTVETPVTSFCLSIDCLKSKTDRMSNKSLHIESAARYKHYMQVMMGYCYIDKGS